MDTDEDIFDQPRKLAEIIKVGGVRHRILINPDCKICQAKDHKGKSIRMKVDKMKLTKKTGEIIAYCKEFGVEATADQLKNHFIKHSSYIESTKKELKEKIDNTVLSKIDTLESEFRDAEDVLQMIINIGGAKIEAGDIEVTDKTLMAALKEQGTRKKTGTLRELLTNLDRARFPVMEGQVVEQDQSKSS